MTTATTNPATRPARLNRILTWGIPLILTSSFAFLAVQPDLRHAVPELVAATAGSTAILAAALAATEKGLVEWRPSAILTIALLFRLLFLFRPAELSDDVNRYLWDGINLIHGRNPYAAAPAETITHDEGLRELKKLVNHPELVTIYPPAAQLVFAAGTSVGTVTGIKGVLSLIDLAGCAALIALLRNLGLPQARAVLYAWHPLPVIEIASSGHIDGAGVAGIFFVLLLLVPRRRGPPATTPGIATPGEKGHGLLAGAIFAATVLIKLVPLVYAPAIIAMARKARAQVIAGAGAGIVVLAAPFLPDLRNGLVTLGIYLERWEFAGFAYRSLRAATGSGETARFLLVATFILTCGVIYGRSGRNGFVPGDDGPASTGSLIRAMYLATLCLLLLTPTLHPWYALYLAALLPLAAEPAGLVLSWSVFLGYRVLIPYAILGRWIEDSLVPALIAVPPLVVLAATAWLRRRRPPAR